MGRIFRQDSPFCWTTDYEQGNHIIVIPAGIIGVLNSKIIRVNSKLGNFKHVLCRLTNTIKWLKH